MVLRTGQLVLVNTALMTRLAQPIIPPPSAEQVKAAKPTLGLSSGTLHIKPAPYDSTPPAPQGPGLHGRQQQ